jgi:hypothetical protein
MKKLFIKILIYTLVILLALEVLIRVFHLTKDYPVRFIDEFGVEKWVPNQDGFSVTGIRRQNFSKFHINNSGYNSFREFSPSKDKLEIALIGNSFIEGFHQDYYNSIGKKIENLISGLEVYEFGYAGYDFADQLHLIHQYQSTFDLIDHVFMGLKFEEELRRGEYGILQSRMKLESPLYKSLRQIKLLVYLQKIGAFDAARELTIKILSFGQKRNKKDSNETIELKNIRYKLYIKNFESLIDSFGFDKERFTLLLDEEKTPSIFISYLNENEYKYLDFSKTINQSISSTNLIYDKHWNNHGRTLIANILIDYLKTMGFKGVNQKF